MTNNSDINLIWDTYLHTVTDSSLYDYCSQNTSVALDILSKFDQSYPPSINVGPGWIPIIFSLHNKILSLVNDYKIYQIKEKFGGLRFYAYPIVLDAASDQNKFHINQIYNHLVQVAEKQSFLTCELCANPGKFVQKNRYRTLCDNCS